MTENEMREKIARLPIKAEWKANLLSGTHLLHRHPDSVRHEDDAVIYEWNRQNYKFVCLLFDDGFMNGWTMLNGNRTGFLITPQPGSNAYWYEQLESFIYADELDLGGSTFLMSAT